VIANLLLLLMTHAALAAEPETLGGIVSPYTAPVAALARGWPPKDLASLRERPGDVKIRCLTHPGDGLYIGAVQFMHVNAPLAKVREILESYPDYAKLFDGLAVSEVRERQGDRLTLYTEQTIPFPFIPNEKTETYYLTTFPAPDRVFYRYQLKASNHLKFSDGLSVAEATPSGTDYYEYDFFDADWGMAKALGAAKLWRESLNGFYQSSLAVKLKAESPGASFADIRRRSIEGTRSEPLTECYDHRREASLSEK
jgi:hypothetical protein